MSFKVIGIGELLWDFLVDGRQMGGAPANFAYHSQSLGAQAGVISRVGQDALGQEIQDKFSELRLPLQLVQTDASAPTGTVTVVLSGEGIPEFTIRKNVAWDYIASTAEAQDAARQADAICFGTLAQRTERSHSTILNLLSLASPASLRVCDINLRQNFYSKDLIETSLGLANVVKLNDSELEVLSGMFDLKGDVANKVAELSKRFELRVVALTRGPLGSLLYKEGRWSECQSRPVVVKDTVGAGDAFTAALVMGLLQDMELEQINMAANEVARHVCSCAGATPPLPEHLRALFLPFRKKTGALLPN